jgi:hypothetical protein
MTEKELPPLLELSGSGGRLVLLGAFRRQETIIAPAHWHDKSFKAGQTFSDKEGNMIKLNDDLSVFNIRNLITQEITCEYTNS